MLVVSSNEMLIASSFCLRMLISAFSNRLLSYSALKNKQNIKTIFLFFLNLLLWSGDKNCIEDLCLRALHIVAYFL